MAITLIGCMDSPFVRRAALALRACEIAFDRRALSVFGDFQALRAIHPLGRAPALALEDGAVIPDSSAIVEWAERTSGRRLAPAEPDAFEAMLAIEAVALGLAEKAVALRGETIRRPPTIRDRPAIARIETQIACALDWLEAAIGAPFAVAGAPTRADLALVCALRHLAEKQAPALRGRDRLTSYLDRLEASEPFSGVPFAAEASLAAGEPAMAVLSTRRAEIALRRSGEGPPLLCLHGFPQTGLAFRALAASLAERFEVIVPDLPGYGASALVEPGDGGMSKRALAADMIELMAALGHERFAVAGHDRGGRIAYRMALDRPEAVSALIAIDILPTLDVWEAMDHAEARAAWHWSFLAAPAPTPERALHAERETLIGGLLDRWAGEPLEPEARAAYVGQYADWRNCVSAAEDYRAGAGVDLEADRADREAGRKIAAPTFAPWGARYLGDPPMAAIWRRWCAGPLEVERFDCGHFLAEERPRALAASIADFLARHPLTGS